MSILTLATSAIASNRPERPVGDPFLRLQLAEGVNAVFAMQQVQEVHTLPADRLTPLPNLPACVLGLMNRRNCVLWVVDLAFLLGIANLGANHQQYNLVIVRVGELALALAVQHISGFFWMPAEVIQPPHSQFSPLLQTHLQGCAVHEQDILLVLSAEAILHSSLLHTSS
ncbi:MAG: chemotaxis protein CheW [Oscillatoriales cyanobacterium C42_A2020_001]|nr:chemotaxis protein CheW [Leptolyngbyaceae cyanobacterium C42_A2020_001]